MSLRKIQMAMSNDLSLDYEVSRAAIYSLVYYITEELKSGNSVTIPGLGRFSLRRVKSYVTVGRLNKGPAKVRIHPAADYPKFTPSPTLKKNIWKVRKPDYGKKERC
jgi:nucleoid DNA-binding protein